MTFPIDWVRGRFPALALSDDGRRRIHLDGPAGTQVPGSVAEAVARCLVEANANLGGAFATSEAAGRVVDEAHAAMADLLGASGPDEIVIGPSMTTLTLHLSRSIGRTLKPGDEVVVTRMDHEGNVAPWLAMAADAGATVRRVAFDRASWQVEPEALSAVLGPRTRVVCLNHASNLTGAINGIAALTATVRAKAPDALVYVDSVQFAPHGLVDVAALGCDFLACSSYKFFGPHLGIVWGRREILGELTPYKCRCASDALPERWETGTPQVELLAGLTAAVDYMAALGAQAGGEGDRRTLLAAAYAASIAWEEPLARTLIDGLMAIPGLTVHGITDPARMAHRVPTVSVTVEGIAPALIAAALAEEGIFVWSGHNYALEVVRQLGIPEEEGVVRLGIAHYNTPGEIAETVEAVTRIVAMLRQQRA